jgi:DNA-binding transcriptional LysR family regulator
MKVFVAVAREGSFGRAAKFLGMSQSALSQAVGQMEFLLTVRLFDRTTRAVKLTEAGAAFLVRIERVTEDLDVALQDLEEVVKARRGQVTAITTPAIATRFFPPIIAAFRDLHPDVSIILLDESTMEITNRLKRGEASMAVCSDLTDDPEIIFEPLIEDEYRVIFRKDHPLASSATVYWRDIIKYEFISFSRSTSLRRELEKVLPDPSPLAKAVYQISNMGSIYGLLENGHAVSIQPALACPLDDHPTLCHRQIAEHIPRRVIGLNTLSDHALSPAADALRTLMIDMVNNGTGIPAPHVSIASKRVSRRSQTAP